MPEPALRLVQAHIAAATEAGIPTGQVYPLLRTITSYALGAAFAELSWTTGRVGCAPDVSDLLRRGIPDDLARIAEVFCGESDHDQAFELGLDLMLRGVDCQTTEHR
jgi:hypothetical protein